MGVIATRRIPAGSILLTDPFVLSVHEPAAEEEEEEFLLRMALLQLADQYAALPLSARRQLAGLHAHAEPDARRRLRAALGGSDAQTAELVERLYSTFITNEFSRVEPGAAKCTSWRTRRLFLTTSRINHSCCPNARSSQTTDGRKVVTALRNVEEGEEITLRYLDHYRYVRGEEWREATQRMWGFVCNCRGCAGKGDGY